MSTAELAKATSLHPKTILKMVANSELSTTPIGGSHGHEFPADAPEQVRKLLHLRHRERTALRRKNRSHA